MPTFSRGKSANYTDAGGGGILDIGGNNQAAHGSIADINRGHGNSQDWANVLDPAGIFHDNSPQYQYTPWQMPNLDMSMPEVSSGNLSDYLNAAYQNAVKYQPLLQDQNLALSRQYLPQYQQLAQQLRSSDRASNLNDVQTLLPQYQNLERNSQVNGVYQMRQMLGNQIANDLAQGQNLDPEGARLASQYSRSADLARGVSQGSGSANREAVAKALAGRSLQNERQNKAMAFGTWEGTQRYDPLASTMNMPNQAMTAAYGSYAQPYNLMQQMNQTGQQALAADNQMALAKAQMAMNAQNQLNALAMTQSMMNYQNNNQGRV